MLQDLNEISDGKIYSGNDMVRAACKDCAGCHACCEQMGASIVIDPMDMWRLTAATGKQFEELMADAIELNVVDGMILPNLKMTGKEEQCYFLNSAGRCSIHGLRPGLCRTFPLGRIYEENGIRYFMQQGACQKEKRAKVKVSKWLDTPQLGRYEQFLFAWHRLRRQMEKSLQETDEQTVKTWNLFLLNLFFVTPYETDMDFYPQFEARLEKAAQILRV